jgi:zinc protease
MENCLLVGPRRKKVIVLAAYRSASCSSRQEARKMIRYERFELDNGLRMLVHLDNSTPMAAVSVLYNVGARDESPDKTGLAHLCEHLMFCGSANAPDFDVPIQKAGGENNAFTNNDITVFHETLPAANVETAFWLESDRMLALNFDEKALDVQRRVVLEEFKEVLYGEPFGDAWHHLSEMAYKVHPYRWPTIGKAPKHLEDVTIEDAKEFHAKYYHPNNAIIAVAGNVSPARARAMIEYWFADIPSGVIPERCLPKEPPQLRLERRVNEANVPVDALFLAFHGPARTDVDYHAVDLLADILGNGSSSRLYHRLVKERGIATEIDASITGSIDPGLFVIETKPADGVSLETLEAAIWNELKLLQHELVESYELQKIKNKAEASLAFSEISILNKAVNLAYLELLGDASLINRERTIYQAVSAEDIRRVAREMFIPENCSELYYIAKKTHV